MDYGDVPGILLLCHRHAAYTCNIPVTEEMRPKRQSQYEHDDGDPKRCPCITISSVIIPLRDVLWSARIASSLYLCKPLAPNWIAVKFEGDTFSYLRLPIDFSTLADFPYSTGGFGTFGREQQLQSVFRFMENACRVEVTIPFNQQRSQEAGGCYSPFV